MFDAPAALSAGELARMARARPCEHILRYTRSPDKLHSGESDGRRAYDQPTFLHLHQVRGAIDEFWASVRMLIICDERTLSRISVKCLAEGLNSFRKLRNLIDWRSAAVPIFRRHLAFPMPFECRKDRTVSLNS
jgi:hypothetical protein